MGRKREVDNVVARSWYRHMYIHAAPCADCGHPEWRHLGLVGTACTHLGACPCRAFTLAMKESA